LLSPLLSTNADALSVVVQRLLAFSDDLLARDDGSATAFTATERAAVAAVADAKSAFTSSPGAATVDWAAVLAGLHKVLASWPRDKVPLCGAVRRSLATVPHAVAVCCSLPSSRSACFGSLSS
jgi:hypothetical protein